MPNGERSLLDTYSYMETTQTTQMIESELLFNQQGEPFAVPQNVVAVRIKKLRGGRGAPELQYGRDGRPLTLPIDATMEDLREVVESSGRFRLDPIDEDGKCIENVQPSYVQVTVSPRNASSVTEQAEAAPVTNDPTSFALRELVRANVELSRTYADLAKSVATQQPDLVRAAAEILRAADGAGLPRRDPMAAWDDNDTDDHDGDPADDAEPSAPRNEVLATLQQFAPLISKWTGVDVTKAPGVPAVVTPTHAVKTSSQEQASAEAETVAETPPFVAADPMTHLMAIQSQLSPDERAFVEAVMKRMTFSALIEARDHFARMTVEDAVESIRAEIEKKKQEHKNQKEKVSS